MTPGPYEARRPARFTTASTVLDGCGFALAFAWLLRWLVGAWSWPIPLALHAWSLAGPFVLLGAGLALKSRRLGAATLHLALLAGWTAEHVPRIVRGPSAPASGGVTFLSLNAGNGRSAPGELARWTRERAADVVFLQELDARQAAALERECAELYPFRELFGLGLRGVGVLSRFPLSGARCIELSDGSLALAGELELESRTLAFAVVHLSGWTSVLGPWGDADSSLAAVLAHLDGAELALVAGDFNATDESPLLDGVRAAGFTSAFGRVGSGLGLSFPEFLRYRGLPLPPLVRIDHVFLRGLEPKSARFLPGAGSDHRALHVETVVGATAAR